MTRRSLIPLALAAFIGVGSMASAQIFQYGLNDAEKATLSPMARASYEEAVFEFDRVNTDAALEQLAVAAAIDTNHISLQFLLVNFARRRAEVNYGEQSMGYYDMAESALRRLLANPDLDPAQRSRVNRESERIREGKEGIRRRDEARLTSGLEVMRHVRNERLVRTGIAARAAEIRSIDEDLRVSDPVVEEGPTLATVWPILGAPGLAIDLNPPPPQQFGGMWGMDARGMGMMDPTMMYGGWDDGAGGRGGGFGPGPAAAPFGAAPGADPFGAPGGGFGDPFAAPGGGFGQPGGGFGQPGGGFGQPGAAMGMGDGEGIFF